MSKLFEEQQRLRELDKLRRHTPFDSKRQWYPADLFILKGFDTKGFPVWERNPKWHSEDGFYIGRSHQ